MTATSAPPALGSVMEFDQTFPPEPRAVSQARRFVRACLANRGVSSEDAEFVVSELMGNVVQHARTPVTVKLEVGRTLRLEVQDGNSIIPAIVDAAQDAESGRGLFIISNLAVNWGIDTTDDGKCVWVELTRESG